MLIERVTIGAFGPVEDETLELAPGMTIVYGPNESAKTSLHAATYAAVCGIRRARGQPRADDREFAARHRPWDGDRWEVRAVLLLADRRRIEVSQDLDARVDCRAMDIGIGRDVSSEVMYEGSPDGSRWLGFNRGSFLSAACVRQAQIAAVLDRPDALQAELQRAAASAGRDETAGAAIERLKDFSRERVGLDRANSTRPLRRAMDRERTAKEGLEAANDSHDSYLQALSQVDLCEQARDAKRQELRVVEAVRARAAARQKSREAERAEELASRYPEEPSGAASDQQTADAVAEALGASDRSPPKQDLSGPTIEELEARLDVLPERPQGDLTPAQEMLDAEGELRTARQVVEAHEAQKPAAVTDAGKLPPNVTADELGRLADRLEATRPEVDPNLQARVAELRERPAGRRRSVALPLGAAAGLAVAAFVSLGLGASVPGVVLLIAAAVAGGAALALRVGVPDATSGETLSVVEQALADQEAAARRSARERDEAVERLEAVGLTPDADAVRDAAARVAAAYERAQALERWAARRHTLEEELERARLNMHSALDARGVSAAAADVSYRLASYKEDCGGRERQERQAMERPALERDLGARRTAESQAKERNAALEGLMGAAQRVGIGHSEPQAAASELRQWQRRRGEDLAKQDRAQREWSELRTLLGEGTLEALKTRAESAVRRAVELETDLEPDDLRGLDSSEAAERVEPLRGEVADLERQAARAQGELKQMSAELPSVAQAEEELAAARRELERVRTLETTMAKTVEFLERAEERVHRTIAPVLRESLRRWLPRIVVAREDDRLVERYDDVVVDPETLQVKVRRGQELWRDAAYLSEGTKEQIYLLLRVALTEHLTAHGESSPLILDEVTAQCDPDRRVALLDLLHEMSEDRQLILFTHDEGVLEWARRSLAGERDTVVEREPVPAPGG